MSIAPAEMRQPVKPEQIAEAGAALKEKAARIRRRRENETN